MLVGDTGKMVSEFLLLLLSAEQSAGLWEWGRGVEVTVSCSLRWLLGKGGGNDVGDRGLAAAFEGLQRTGQPAGWPHFPRLQDEKGQRETGSDALCPQ